MFCNSGGCRQGRKSCFLCRNRGFLLCGGQCPAAGLRLRPSNYRGTLHHSKEITYHSKPLAMIRSEELPGNALLQVNADGEAIAELN